MVIAELCWRQAIAKIADLIWFVTCSSWKNIKIVGSGHFFLQRSIRLHKNILGVGKNTCKVLAKNQHLFRKLPAEMGNPSPPPHFLWSLYIGELVNRHSPSKNSIWGERKSSENKICIALCFAREQSPQANTGKINRIWFSNLKLFCNCNAMEVALTVKARV